MTTKHDDKTASVEINPSPEGMGLGGAPCYAPQVGDEFHRKAGRYTTADGRTIHHSDHGTNFAKVTMLSPGHVVYVINGFEYTSKRGEFIRLAKRTLANGATLSRGHNDKITDAAANGST